MSAQMTVRLPADLAELVDQRARKLRLRRSDIIRMALHAFLEEAPQPDEQRAATTPYERVAHLIGSIDSGIPDLGSRHEEHLRELFDRGR